MYLQFLECLLSLFKVGENISALFSCLRKVMNRTKLPFIEKGMNLGGRGSRGGRGIEMIKERINNERVRRRIQQQLPCHKEKNIFKKLCCIVMQFHFFLSSSKKYPIRAYLFQNILSVMLCFGVPGVFSFNLFVVIIIIFQTGLLWVKLAIRLH